MNPYKELANAIIVQAVKDYRDAVERIYHHLKQLHISTGIYHGGLEQIDREKAIAMFNNESYPILVSTDLGSRGLDIKEVKNEENF